MNRSSLKDIVKGRSGAFDMPSIVTAVVVLGILVVGVLATVFGVIPMAQDNATKQDISAARTAEGVARAKDNKFMDTNGLVAAGYLPDTTVSAAGTSPAGETIQLVSSTTRKKVAATTNAAGTCYVALGKSGTGKVFYGTDTVADPEELRPGTAPGCITSDQTTALVTAVGGFSGVAAPAAPTVTGTVADPSTASFAWNAVDGATGYRVEDRINGGTWSLQQDNQTGTGTTVSANGGDTVDLRVTARNAGGDSPYGTATVKLPVPVVADGSFETGLSPWTGTGNTALVAGTAHTGAKSAGMAYDGSSYVGTLSEAAAIPDNAVSTLTFWYDASLTSSSSSFRFEVRDSAGTTTLATPLSKVGPLAATGWTQATVDMTPWRGQTVTLWAYGLTYGSSYVHWDDFAITSAPPTAPAAPALVGASGADQSAAVTWAAAASPGTDVTGYTVTPFLDGSVAQAPVQVDGKTTTATVAGLANGSSYTFAVTATNMAGTSPAGTSAAVTPGPAAIANGGFEAGLANWTASSSLVTAATDDVHTGIRSAKLGNATTSGDYSVTQAIAVPDNATSILTFWYDANEPSSNDHLQIQVRNSAGTILGTPFSNTNAARGWTQASVDLTPWRGQTITLAPTMHAWMGSAYAYVDDFALTSTPPTAPAAPTAVGATAADASATVTWAAAASPATNVTGYTVTPYIYGAAQSPVQVDGTTTSTTITGLTNGSTYTFTVTATNMAGTSPASAPSAAVLPNPVAIANGGFESGLASWTASSSGVTAATDDVHSGVRSAKLGNATTSGDYSASQAIAVPDNAVSTLTFWYDANEPSSNDHLQIQVRNSAGTILGTPFSNTNAARGWTQGSVDMTPWRGQTVTLAPTMHAWMSSAYAYVDDFALTSTPPTAPVAPTAVGATAADASATVTWAAAASPSTNVTGYTVTPYLGGAAQAPVQVSGTTTSTTITGLTNGSSYTFAVTATNMAGTSAAGTSAAVTPGPVTVANGGFEAGLASWTASSGATAATDDVHSGVRSAKLGTATTSGDYSVSQAIAVPDNASSTLTFWYDANEPSSNDHLQIQVRNSAGTILGTPFFNNSAARGWTQASADMTPWRGQTITLAPTMHAWMSSAYAYVDDFALTTAPPTAPTAPTAVGATGNDKSATVMWGASSSPATNITGYTVTAYLAGAAQAPVQVSGTTTSTTITGLTNGSSYTFAVTATNMAGTSAAGTSGAVTPGPVAIANGGFEAGFTNWTPASSAQISTATTHTGARAAQLGNSNGGDSQVSQVIAVPDNATSTMAFWYNTTTASGYTGNTFKVQVFNSANSLLGTPYSKTGIATSNGWAQGSVDLTPWRGQTVTLWLDQYNYATGTNASSTLLDDIALTTAPPTVTAAPANVGATGNNGSAAVAWTAPASPATNITGYTVTPYLAGAAQAPVQVSGTATSTTVSGLTNGSSYTFTVTATNMAGTSAAGTSAAVTPGPVAVANGGFEAGFTNWTPASSAQISTATTHTGVRAAQLGNSNGGDSQVTQVVAVPDNATSTLAFWYNTTTASGYTGNAFKVQVWNSTGSSLLGTPYSKTGIATSNGWAQASVDLTPWRGQTITLGFDQYNYSTGTNASSTLLDDIALTTTPAAVPVAPAAVTAAPGNGSANVSWAAASSPGSTITGYTVTPYLAGAAQTPVKVSGTTTSTTVAGLTNGSSYTFAVTATNGVGTSASSAQSAAVVPGTTALANGGFESALVGWTTGGAAAPAVDTTTAHSGAQSAKLGNQISSDSNVSQTVTVPAAGTTTLSLWYSAHLGEAAACTTSCYDYLDFQVRSSSGATLKQVYKGDSTVGWTNLTADLTPYAGQTVTLWFNQHNDGSNISWADLDDISVTNK